MSPKPLNQSNIFRIDKVGSNKKKGETHGWQVRIQRDNKPTSKFFSDNRFPSKDLALEAAQKFRDEMYEILGISSPGEHFKISDELASNNSSGIVGVHRSEYLTDTTAIYSCWQTTFPNIDEGIETKKFSISRYGEIGALKMAVEFRLEGISKLIGTERYYSSQDRIKNLIEKYLNILIYLDRITSEEESFLLNTILDKTIRNTTKEEIVNGRVGQGTFKEKLSIIWNNRCCITGASILLSASHIKPWAACSSGERLDPFNGFLLSPVYDRAFDQGFISFQDTGRIMISPLLSSDITNLSINPNAKIENISPFSFHYLLYHRNNIFISCKM